MNFINSPPPPRLPDAPPQYQGGTMAGFINVLRLYFNRLSGVLSALFGTDGAIELQTPHAMLMSDVDQTSGGTTVANTVTYNQPVILQGIEVRNGDEIWFEKPGQYLVTFTLQVTNRDNQDHLFEVWAKYNGTNYPLSNTRFDVPQRKSASEWGHIVPAITGIFTVEDPTNDYLSIAWWSDSTLVFLEHYAADTSPDRPEIPSVILTVQGVSRLPITP
jgi:hypothetical protein